MQNWSVNAFALTHSDVLIQIFESDFWIVDELAISFCRRHAATLCSPFILFYGLALCCLQYIWAMELQPELPTSIGTMSLRQLGLDRAEYPCLRLGAMVRGEKIYRCIETIVQLGAYWGIPYGLSLTIYPFFADCGCGWKCPWRLCGRFNEYLLSIWLRLSVCFIYFILQLLFTLTFWLLVRQSVKENFSKKRKMTTPLQEVTTGGQIFLT